MKSLPLSLPILLLVACLFPQVSMAQVSPTLLRDVAYDHDHASQCLDVYLTKSDTPTPAMIHIHGGGWRGGSKQHVPGWLLKLVADGKLSVISVEYRFTDVETHPAQVNDCLRAIQFVRANSEKWNVDPHRLGVTGGSAGGHLTTGMIDGLEPARSTAMSWLESRRHPRGTNARKPFESED